MAIQMLTKGDAIGVLRNEFPHLNSCYGIKRIGLFGSFARGTQKEDSDIDILVEFERPIGFRFMEFAEYIEKLVGKKADILTPEGLRSIRVKKISQDIERSVVYV